MVNFCQKCGQKINPDEKFCKNCGTKLAESVVDIQEKPLTPKNTISAKNPTKYIVRDVVKACIQILILGLFLYWVWYSYNCAVGNHLGNGDQMCQSFYQLFNSKATDNTSGGGGGGTKIGIGCQHCLPGYCWTESHCCPSSAQYYCKGSCYRSSNEAYNAGCHQSSWTRWCCPQ